ncbi:hypothetical protein CERSUDRAFT_121752 [Gelatoporia subvermispora B]|uniref:F-box domain-containing protein n=1 Tax=Ceriporiopsis subvermispora (strain B) TaxID=914234 RepID=M2RL08_CERS8|nr:hypothetical protein CERSUDRAFT_121752 [Gelatoporia subvermispora B]
MTLPPEIISRIAQYAHHADLLSLTRVCKTSQSASEAILYETLYLRDAEAAYFACQAIITHNGARGTYVRRFWFCPDLRRSRPFPSQFWQAVQVALTKMDYLEYLVLNDPTGSNTWVLTPGHFKFELHDASFNLKWDENLVAFLATQHKLRVLSTLDSLDGEALCGLPAGSLQNLTTFSGPLLVLAELVESPLTHVQIQLENDTAVILETVLSDLSKLKKGLRSLNIIGIPSQYSLETLQLVSKSMFQSNLHHLGVLPLPWGDRVPFRRCLMQLHSLENIEVDVSRWDPPPSEPFQRMIAAELRVYCPTLRRVIFVILQQEHLWYCRNEEWFKSLSFVSRKAASLPISIMHPSPSSSASTTPHQVPHFFLTMQPARTQRAQTHSIAALPSLAHSLSSFPTMTTVSQDMVHYGTMGRTKKIGEAKRTKQRQDAIPSSPVGLLARLGLQRVMLTILMQSMPSPATHTQSLPGDDEPMLSIKRRQKVRALPLSA